MWGTLVSFLGTALVHVQRRKFFAHRKGTMPRLW
jgi:hypothetical protein